MSEKDLSAIDLTKIDLSSVDLSVIDISTIGVLAKDTSVIDIAENELSEQLLFEPERSKKHALKKPLGYLGLFIFASVLIHVFVVYLLVSVKVSLPETPKVKKSVAIKSYLYRAPKKVVKSVVAPVVKKSAESKLKIELETQSEAKPKPKLTPKFKSKSKSKSKPKPKQPQAATDDPKSVQKEQAEKEQVKKTVLTPVIKRSVPELPSPKVTQVFSVQSQLAKLRNRVDQQILAEEMQQYQAQQPSSAAHSVMHKGYGLQPLVPHVEIALTPEQKREKNTSKMDHISIIKGDDGTCTIIREAFPGSPVPASASSFACGESKFDKSFRQHMERVREKIMPIRKSKK